MEQRAAEEELEPVMIPRPITAVMDLTGSMHAALQRWNWALRSLTHTPDKQALAFFSN